MTDIILQTGIKNELNGASGSISGVITHDLIAKEGVEKAVDVYIADFRKKLIDGLSSKEWLLKQKSVIPLGVRRIFTPRRK